MFKSLPFIPSTATVTLTKVTEPILFHCCKLGITLCLHLQNTLLLLELCSQMRRNVQRIVAATEISFVLSPEKCPLKFYTFKVIFRGYDHIPAPRQGVSHKD